MRSLILAVLLGLGLGLAGPGAASPLDERIAATRPCAQVPQLDQTDFVRVDAAKMEIVGEVLAMSGAGALGCKTSDAAVLQADASTAVEITAAVALADCTTADVSAHLFDFGGSLGMVLELMAEELEVEIERAVTRELARICGALLGP